MGRKSTVTVVKARAAFSWRSLLLSTMRKCWECYYGLNNWIREIQTQDSKSAVLRAISPKFCSVSSVEWRLNCTTEDSLPWCFIVSTETDLASQAVMLSSRATSTRCWSSSVEMMASSSDFRNTNFSWHFLLRGSCWTSYVCVLLVESYGLRMNVSYKRLKVFPIL
jgi:hypothetical protein